MAGAYDLHCHLFGCLDEDEVVRLAARGSHPWDLFESGYERVHGSPAGIRAIVADLRRGDPTARQRLLDLYHFRDRDGPGFDRFQATADLTATLLAWPQAGQARQGCQAEFAELVPAICARHRAQGLAGVEYRVLVPLALRPRRAGRLLGDLADRLAAEAGPSFRPRLAIGLPRQAPLRFWPVVAELASNRDDALISAVDVCGPEQVRSPATLGGLAAALHDWNRSQPSGRWRCSSTPARTCAVAACAAACAGCTRPSA